MKGQILGKIEIPQTFAKQRTMSCKETLQLLQSYGFKFYSWGAHAFTNIQNKALRMKVNGHHHKGHVYISVNGMDLYDVHIVEATTGQIKEIITDLYFDQLFETIDNRIERIPEYKD